MTLNLDKATWKHVTFGDVVRNVNVTVRAPEAAGIDRVIAMEHMDPGELQIQRWGPLKDGTTFTRRVRPGQTLFGKRRAYQRKVAYAEFDAICSSDILTFEADRAQMLAEFLPFLVQSSEFFDHALGTSAGSLSPRTNWRDLANFEFELPPLDDQKRIADLLWAVERHRRNVTVVLHSLEIVRRQLNEVTFRRWMTSGTTDLESLYDFQIGKRLSPEGRARGGDPFPYVTNFNVQWRHIDFSEVRQMAFLEREQPIYEIKPGDVLACEARFVGRSAVWPDGRPGHMYQMSLHRLRHRDGELRPHMLVEFLDWCARSGAFKRLVGDNLIPHLPEVRFRKLAAPSPPSREAREFEAKHEVLASAIRGATAEVAAVTVLSASLLADIFEGMLWLVSMRPTRSVISCATW